MKAQATRLGDKARPRKQKETDEWTKTRETQLSKADTPCDGYAAKPSYTNYVIPIAFPWYQNVSEWAVSELADSEINWTSCV